MNTESQPVNLKKAWISAHPRVVIGFILVACLGPFINQAIQTDDANFVWAGEWIQKHPADFFGAKVNWWFSAIPMWVAIWDPPLMSYFLAGMASLFGWSEMNLHLACLAVAFTAAAGIYSLAQRWCKRPLLATVVAMFTPAFLVSSMTIMCDVFMLMFWIWALVFWERALDEDQSRWQFVWAGVLAGLAVLTKYNAITLLPLLPILSIFRARKAGWWLAGLAVTLIIVTGYEWITAKMYGRGLLAAAVHNANGAHLEFPGGWKARDIIGLAFAGGCFLPLLFFAPLLWRRRVLLTGGVAMLGSLLLAFRLCDNFGLTIAAPDPMKHWGFLIQVILLTAGGLHLLLLVAAEIWRRRDVISMMLALWILSELFCATVLNWTVNARGFLPIVPAAAILLVRRLDTIRGRSVTDGWLLWPLIPTAAISLSLVMADYQLANSARTAAEQIAAKYKSASHQMWFEGHWGFQYYMEKLGGQPIDVERSLLQPGDVVIVPEIGLNILLPAGSVGWLEHLQYTPFSWMNLAGCTESGAAGFYGAYYGPVPFAIGQIPQQNYYVVKVFSPIQWNSKPTNPREVLAGDMPAYSHLAFQAETAMTFASLPEVIDQVQRAAQLQTEGKIEAAIQQYYNALRLDSNSPVVLNNLAWILATTSKSELRNGEVAVQLAARAVELTDYRQPLFIGTLAAAYAQAGRFPQACDMALTACALALITDQKEIFVNNQKLLSLYSSGKTVDATSSP
jgi:4-amino-4-deoxy-L-arabinose transferase-like glycosyltransferase